MVEPSPLQLASNKLQYVLATNPGTSSDVGKLRRSFNFVDVFNIVQPWY